MSDINRINGSTRILNNFYYLLLFFLVLIVYTMPLNNPAILGLTLNAFIYLNVIIFIFALIFKKKRDNYSIKMILFVSFSILFSLIYFDSLKVTMIAVALSYLSSFMMVYYTQYIPVTKKLVNIITAVCILSSIIFIINFFSPLAYRYIKLNEETGLFNEITHNALSLGYPNANTAASIITPIAMILFILANIYRNRFFSLFLKSLSILLTYFVFLTSSRSSFFSLILFILFVVFRIKINITKSLVMTILLSVFAFVFVYAFLYSQNIGSDWVLLGKPFFSGREEYLSNMFFEGSNSWLLGDISKYKYNNYLNGMLSIYLSGGIINVILYILFFSHNIAKRFNIVSTNSHLALIAILFLYFQSFGEGNFMVSGAYFSVLISILYILSNIRSTTLEVRVK